jgi:hypothetical protein
MRDPRLRIEVLEKSMRGFACGWIGLIPVLGGPLAIYAILLYFQVQRLSGEERNPAQRYLLAGLALGLLGAIFSCLVSCALTMLAYRAWFAG